MSGNNGSNLIWNMVQAETLLDQITAQQYNTWLNSMTSGAIQALPAYWDVSFAPGQDIWTAPGCHPQNFSFEGVTGAWVQNSNGDLPWAAFTSQPPQEWIDFRNSHGMMGITMREAYHGVGLPGQFSATQSYNINECITHANLQYPQYQNLINHPVHGQSAWARARWFEFNSYPFEQIANGDQPNQCHWWMSCFIWYLKKMTQHVHGNPPVYGSYSGVTINPNTGLYSNWWIYVYIRLIARAHFMQHGMEACSGCPSFIDQVWWLEIDDPYWFNMFNTNSVSKILGSREELNIDREFSRDPIHQNILLISRNKLKQAQKVLKNIKKNIKKDQYISEEQDAALLKEYLENEQEPPRLSGASPSVSNNGR